MQQIENLRQGLYHALRRQCAAQCGGHPHRLSGAGSGAGHRRRTRGRIIEIYGPESSGKTTLALHVLAQAQKMGGEVAFVDAEHALDPTYARALG